MRQRFSLDQRRLAIYLALGVGGCTGQRVAPILPVAAVPVSLEQVRGWVRPTVPTIYRLHRFKWQFVDDRSAAGGRGSVRIAPPDSFRLDVAGPLGAGKAAAVVVGAAPAWTEPPDAIARLVPNYPLMWAMFGVARMPDSGAALRGLSDDRTTAWQYVLGADTVEYARVSGTPIRFSAEVREAGKVVGRAEARLNEDGTPISSRLTVPSVPARLDITFTQGTRPTALPPETWRPPQP